MSGLRRLLVIAAATAGILGLAIPAQAAFTDRTTVAISSTTTTVAAPTGLTTGGTKCVTTYDAYGNPTGTTLQAKLSWKASTTPKVTSYEVRAYASGWSYSVVTVGATSTSVSGTYDSYYATQNIQVTVTARTAYGWTAESAKSGVIKC
jgi:hypothetical protein